MSDQFAILPAFADPVLDAQQAFRKMLEAMAHPGRIVTFENAPEGPATLSSAATVACLVLADFETPLWMDANAKPTLDYLKFHCGCPVVKHSQEAMFALITEPKLLLNFDGFNRGTNENPEQSCTLIIDVNGLANAPGLTLLGPGIKTITELAIDGVHSSFAMLLADNHRRFPQGVDILLTCEDKMVALPRTTRYGDSPCM